MKVLLSMSFLHLRIIKNSQNANSVPFRRTFKSALGPQCIFNYSKLSTIPRRCGSPRTVKPVGEETGFVVSSDLYDEVQNTPGDLATLLENSLWSGSS
jgi:hypothetical protein